MFQKRNFKVLYLLTEESKHLNRSKRQHTREHTHAVALQQQSSVASRGRWVSSTCKSLFIFELESKTQAAQICGLFSARHESHDKCFITRESRSWSERWLFTSRFCFSPARPQQFTTKNVCHNMDTSSGLKMILEIVPVQTFQVFQGCSKRSGRSPARLVLNVGDGLRD